MFHYHQQQSGPESGHFHTLGGITWSSRPLYNTGWWPGVLHNLGYFQLYLMFEVCFVCRARIIFQCLFIIINLTVLECVGLAAFLGLLLCLVDQKPMSTFKVLLQRIAFSAVCVYSPQGKLVGQKFLVKILRQDTFQWTPSCLPREPSPN